MLLRPWMKYLFCLFVYFSGILALWERTLGRDRFVILMYHRVCDQDDPMGISIRPDFFRKQVRYLKKKFQPMSLEAALDMFRRDEIRDRMVVMTFDDGFRDNFTEAFPVLRSEDFPATIFVTVEGCEKGDLPWFRLDYAVEHARREWIDLRSFGMDRHPIRNPSEKNEFLVHIHSRLKRMEHSERERILGFLMDQLEIGKRDRLMLSWQELEVMLRSRLVEIGSHTLSHPILSRVSRQGAWTEIVESRQRLREKLGIPVRFFAYPNGGPEDFDPGIREMVRNSGYEAACTTIPETISSSSDVLALGRVDVTHRMCSNPWGKFSGAVFHVNISGFIPACNKVLNRC